MNITLQPDQEKLIAEAIQSGAYESPDDVITRALEILRGEEGWLHEQHAEIGRKIERALGQFERGEFLSDEASRAEMEKLKSTWMNEQRKR
jgi:Arc/MetJ-type ribon-helix-helix transcriptional regulator